MTATATTCRGCDKPTLPGRKWHPWCKLRYRRSVDYRTPTLRRDGGQCVKCNRWQNAYAEKWARRTGRPRKLHADHIIPLAGTGTHDPSNMQTLCVRHHSIKTVRDLATLRGERSPASLRRIGLALVVAAMVLYVARDPSTRPALGIVALIVLLAAAGLTTRERSGSRLRHVICAVTGEPVTRRRAAIGRQWRPWRPEGAWLPRLRPNVIKGRYHPETFKDHDAHAIAKLESIIAAKYGPDYHVTWLTQLDRFIARRPDPLADPTPTRWPHMDAPSLDLWKPVPVALDGGGKSVSLTLPYRNLLIGGEPDAGKSASMALLVAAAALDPNVTLHVFDGKDVDLSIWRPHADTFVTTDMDEANEALDRIGAIMEEKYRLVRTMEARPETGPPRKLDQDIATRELALDGTELRMAGLDVVVIDELAYYFHAPVDPKLIKHFTSRLRDLIQRGRAAGVIVVMATQRPGSDVIPTSIRDIVTYRWALRCATSDASDMVLGSGLATLGHRADRISEATPGVGLLKAGSGLPVRCKAHYLTDADLWTLAQRAAKLRGKRIPGQRDTEDGAA